MLYFYPEAMTPGLHDRGLRLPRQPQLASQAPACSVVGVSKDDAAKLKRFAERDGLNFPLLSDEDLAVQQAYGAWGEKTLYGKTVVGLDPLDLRHRRGRPHRARRYNVKATGHVARIRRELGLGG